ncbi:MAG: NUDIX domain-containing protein [Nigerium sp.]|nr:NUDIX domain-containing protein [Nigerium sp.]
MFVVSVTLRNASGDLLVVRKRGSSVFMLPGGKVEAGESRAGGARRAGAVGYPARSGMRNRW